MPTSPNQLNHYWFTQYPSCTYLSYHKK